MFRGKNYQEFYGGQIQISIYKIKGHSHSLLQTECKVDEALPRFFYRENSLISLASGNAVNI